MTWPYRRTRVALPVGSSNVDRAMIRAVVGAPPFGGESLSGIDPKASGPNCMPRFAVERKKVDFPNIIAI
jgi:RHH-type proline utilization regulon transcriptional repressor/proline dehydrogenase/delta 1-pyrroline-5-carboxylate dehydrogenase